MFMKNLFLIFLFITYLVRNLVLILILMKAISRSFIYLITIKYLRYRKLLTKSSYLVQIHWQKAI